MLKEQAKLFLQQQRFSDARNLFEEICKQNDSDAESWFLLGAVNGQLGRLNDAVGCFQKVITLQPSAEAHDNLGLALQALGRFDEAIASHRSALDINSGLVRAYYNLGNAYCRLNDFASAAENFRQACQRQPGFFEALNNLGATLLHLGRFEEALPCLAEANRLGPGNALTHYSLGLCLYRLRRYPEAVAALKRAILLDPNHLDAQFCLGEAYFAARQFPAAIEAYETVVRLRPDYAEAHNNLGLAYLKINALGRALECYRRAVQLNGMLAESHHNLGNALSFAAQHAEAMEFFRKALAVRPTFAHAHSNMLLVLNYFENDPRRLYHEHVAWANKHTVDVRRRTPRVGDRDPDRTLRVGYVSSDLHTHPVAYFLEPLLAAHDRKAFETVCYSDVTWPDETTQRLRSLACQWRDIVGMNNDKVADLVEADKIDVLVDLGGHTGSDRLLVLAQKPAPVQVSYLGYPNTTGLKEIDFRLTDEWADPPGGESDRYHAETLWRLRGGFLCYAPPDVAPEPAAPPSATKGHVTFGSFNHWSKMTPEVIAVWARLLREVPRSRILLKGKHLLDPYLSQRIYDMFETQGIEKERISLRATKSVTTAAHLSMYGEMDVALDTFPYNGTTTTCEALWMGVPVVTLAGRAHAGRVGVSLLHVIGMEQWIAHSAEEYIELAASLAADTRQRTAVRISLRSRVAASGLCDRARLAREVEAAYRQMWRGWCQRTR
jgi:predicted O-linked N-acetylglucosamine transferase (SPINDLY family)